MNYHQTKSQLLRIGRELTDEAQLWPRHSRQRGNLSHASIQCGYCARTLADHSPAVVAAMLGAAVDVLVQAMTARAFSTLDTRRV